MSTSSPNIEVETLYMSPDRLDEDLGIKYLTAESCAFGMRILCDLNEDGVALVKNFFGCEPLHANWNSHVGNKPAIRSVMLSPFAFPELWIHAMIHRGATVLRFKPGRFHTQACALFNASDNTITAYCRELNEWVGEIIKHETVAAPIKAPGPDIGITIANKIIGLRQACMLNPAGQALIAECFGLAAGERIFLTQELLVDLCCYSMVSRGWTVVRFNPGHGTKVRGFFTPSPDEMSAFQQEHNDAINRVYRPPTHSRHCDGRNIHQMSGRTT
ncbi:hypothetical protein AW736_02175 [Termitidicoccus mucosus]|uniref:Uncharacterized protein n=1 Tax=Termitidicoccus mucosus TaxID=1184151 RepID=A0A178IQD8_9BACT|nr:hypothetical protein AW736_02175 [Opitutaceae bacterium TSB47]